MKRRVLRFVMHEVDTRAATGGLSRRLGVGLAGSDGSRPARGCHLDATASGEALCMLGALGQATAGAVNARTPGCVGVRIAPSGLVAKRVSRKGPVLSAVFGGTS